MRIPLTRRLAYAFKKFGRIFNPCIVAHKLECVGAPDSVIDIKTGNPLYAADERVEDYFELLYGLNVLLTQSRETSVEGIYAITLYVAPHKQKITDWSFVYGANTEENQGTELGRASESKKI